MWKNDDPALMPRTNRGVGVFILLLVGVAARAQIGLVNVHEDFSKDPCWDGKQHLPEVSAWPTKTQDFGYSRTHYAGASGGEIGGRICRSARPAAYAKVIPAKTLSDRLRASGAFAVTQSNGGSGVLVGWFNHRSRGWRTPNSLAFRIDGESGEFRVFFEYGTQTWKTGGGTTFEGRYQTTTTPMHKADGTPHTWSLEYDPPGAEGKGEMTFTLDGKVYRASLAPGHKEEGAVFDRFGMFNQQIAGDGLTAYIDDLTIDGVTDPFSTDPGWEGNGNRVTFQDCVVRPVHNFGYRKTNHAGGEPGEIGGVVWRIESMHPEQACYYGAPVGRLSLDQELRASGKAAFRAAAADSAILLGWFHSVTYVGAPPQNFLGILVEGPSRIGHYFRPVCGTSDDIKAVLSEGPIIRPDGKPHHWALHYAPEANEGRGRLVVTLDDESVALDLTPEARKGGAVFDRFGIVSWHRGGHFVEIYFDDISYTAENRRDSGA